MFAADCSQRPRRLHPQPETRHHQHLGLHVQPRPAQKQHHRPRLLGIAERADRHEVHLRAKLLQKRLFSPDQPAARGQSDLVPAAPGEIISVRAGE